MIFLSVVITKLYSNKQNLDVSSYGYEELDENDSEENVKFLENSNSEKFNNGAVVTAHAVASKIGLEILKKGGNAFDCTVAVGFALSVCYPIAGNIGGGGFLVLRTSEGKTETLDFRENAPSASTYNMFLDKKGSVIKKISTASHLSAGVPGTVDGLLTLYDKYCTLPLEQLIDPSIKLAREGFALTGTQANQLNKIRPILIQRNFGKKNPFVKKGIWKKGDILQQIDLARTLYLIRTYGRDGFYSSTTADNLIAEMKRGNGIISKSDLINYKSYWRPPLTTTYKGYRVITMPLPSSGGILLIQMLKMIENFPIRQWGYNAFNTIFLMTEISLRAFADRAVLLGPNQESVENYLDDNYLINKMKSFSFMKRTLPSDISVVSEPDYESEETTHFSIVDKWRNSVACTITLNGNYGSKIIVDGSGFFLNNEMDDFTIKSNHPNMYNLIQSKKNMIEPNKRMLSSMTPTIVEKNNKPYLVLGSPGGPFIISSVFQTLINCVDFNMSVQSAVSAKRIHHQWMPDVLYYENSRFDKTTEQKLEKAKFTLKKRKGFGRVDAILINNGNSLECGADPRGNDTAAGF